MTEKLRIDLELKGDLIERFKAVKEHFGVSLNTCVLRVLIADKYREVRKGAIA